MPDRAIQLELQPTDRVDGLAVQPEGCLANEASSGALTYLEFFCRRRTCKAWLGTLVVMYMGERHRSPEAGGV